MLIGVPGNIAYLRVRKNEISARNIKSGKEVTIKASTPFTSTRLLVGEFRLAEKLVCNAMKEIFPNAFWTTSPAVVVHPLEMVEGGLSEVEERLLKELAIGAGAAMAIVLTGAELTDAEVRAKVSEKQK